MIKHLLPIGFGLLSLCYFSCSQSSPASERLPNIVYILADDLGYGDLSCLNPNSKIQTANIDKLAAEGIRFTDAHSGSSVCTPTRYGVMTGRYSWRSALKQGVTWTNDKHIIPSDRLTVASMLQSLNYSTACVGKWHLGLDWQVDADGNMLWDLPISNGPNSNGFDYFYGIKASLDIPPYFYIENNQITAKTIDSIEYSPPPTKFWRAGPIGDDFVMEEVLPTLMQKSVGFIKEQKDNEDPFFLYFPLPAPHTPIIPTSEFLGRSGTNVYGDFVFMVDHVVGEVMRALEETGQADNTLIIFTNDNGCSPNAGFEELAALGHHPSYEYRGHKADIYEGGNRVPFIARWPAKIKAGRISNEVICLTDFMATAADMVNYDLPDEAAEDSYSLLPILLDEPHDQPLREATIHHSVNGSFAIRKDEWKLIFCPGSGGWSFPQPDTAFVMDLPRVQLYNLSEDIGEQINLEATHKTKVDELTALAEDYIKRGRSTPGIDQTNEGETHLFYQQIKRLK